MLSLFLFTKLQSIVSPFFICFAEQREEETQPSSVATTVPFRTTTTTSPPVMKPTSIHHHHHHHHPLAERTLLLYPPSTQYRRHYRTTPSLTVSSSIPTPRFISSLRSTTTNSSPSIPSSSKTSNINNNKTPLVKNTTNDNNIVNNDHCRVSSSSVDNYNYFEEEVQPANPNPTKPLSLASSDQAFFLLTFIACTATASFTGFVMAAVPTLFAMRRTAIALEKLADTAREELPSTMAAIRLSGMEISDLTLELSDLSQEISDGVNKSAQAVQAAEAGVRQIGSLARQKTMSMIEERANLPVISIQPVVAGVAKKTSQAVGHASKSFMNMISGGDSDDSTLEDGRPSHVDTLES